MFETTKVILTENTRNLIKKMLETPVLYLIFSGMIVFSIFVFAYATFFLLNIDINLDISLEDVFFTVFFMFLLKSIADFHNNFIKSSSLSYSLSSQVNQKKTIAEIFLAVLLIELVIWLSFSSMFLLALIPFRVDFGYPLQYILFILGIFTAICLGCAISLNFFSLKKYRLLPTLILLVFYIQARHPLYVVFTLPLAMLHIAWSIKNGMESYLYSKRKERTKERSQIKIRSIIKTFFHRETIVLWRDKLFLSFIFTSVSTGLFSGYLFLYGDEILIPEAVRNQIGGILPSMFLFLGVYVVIMYTAVFPSLNLFLNEEKTMWIIRHMPVKNDNIIFGKASALALCFLTSIPFIPYITIFTGLDKIVFLFWMLTFSFIAGVIVSVPIGVKYVGKKSDIMLLYSVAMILFVILGFVATMAGMIEQYFDYPIILYVLILLFEILILYVSLKVSSQILTLKYKSASYYS